MAISIADQKSLARDIFRFEHDPWGFVLYAYPWGKGALAGEQPRKWQRDYLCAFRDRMQGWNSNVLNMVDQKATVAGNGNGKSALMSWLLEWGMYTREFTRGYVTAGTFDQLITKTFPELNKWHSLNIARHWFELSATSFYSALAPKDGVDYKKNWRFDIQAWNKSRPESGAGLHNKGGRVLKLFDEASQIPPEVFETGEGSNTDEKTEVIWHIFGNGTRANGYFAEATFGDKAHRWNPTSIDCRDVEGTNKALYAEWIKEYGEDSDFVRTHVRGLLPRSSQLQFIPTEVLELAENRVVEWQPDDPLVMSVDVARGGADYCVIRFRLGSDMRTFPPIRIPGSEIRDSTKLQAKILDVYQNPRQYELPRKPDALVGDANGVGGPVLDNLKRLGLNVLYFTASESSPDIFYANMRAYAWSKLRDALKNHAAVDEDVFLRRDIKNQEATINEADKTILIKKSIMANLGLPSPDDGDAAAMLWAFFIPQIKAPKSAWEKTARGDQQAKPYSLKDRLKKRTSQRG